MPNRVFVEGGASRDMPGQLGSQSTIDASSSTKTFERFKEEVVALAIGGNAVLLLGEAVSHVTHSGYHVQLINGAVCGQHVLEAFTDTVLIGDVANLKTELEEIDRVDLNFLEPILGIEEGVATIGENHSVVSVLKETCQRLGVHRIGTCNDSNFVHVNWSRWGCPI